MNLFSYPNVLLTVFVFFIFVLALAGLVSNLVNMVRYIYLVEYKSNPMLIMHSDSTVYAYYEYDKKTKKYIRNDNASYDKNDPKIYKKIHTDHILFF